MQHKNYIVSLRPVTYRNTPLNTEKVTKETLAKCVEIAQQAFGNKVDMNGVPVILHSMAVGMICRTDEEACAGFLHDVLEDTEYTEDDLRQAGVPEFIIETVKLLTRDYKQKYNDYIKAIIDSKNEIAIRVKYYDLTHNIARADADNMTSLSMRYLNAMKDIERCCGDLVLCK